MDLRARSVCIAVLLMFGRATADAASLPALPAVAFACAAGLRGQPSAHRCDLWGDVWLAWREHQQLNGRGGMSFFHPLDVYYSILGLDYAVPPLVGIPA